MADDNGRSRGVLEGHVRSILSVIIVALVGWVGLTLSEVHTQVAVLNTQVVVLGEQVSALQEQREDHMSGAYAMREFDLLDGKISAQEVRHGARFDALEARIARIEDSGFPHHEQAR